MNIADQQHIASVPARDSASTAAHTTRRLPSDSATRRDTQSARETVEARGFGLYVGLDEVSAAQAGVSLPQLVSALKKAADELVPGVQTHATVAIAPRGSGGRDVDVVRLALHDPAIVSARRRQAEEETSRRGVVVDLSRQRVLVDGTEIALTYKEYSLLAHLVEHTGETVHRNDLLTELWNADEEDTPNERTIDVHVRRLRAKLRGYQDIVRTVRGIGYRFDQHADVVVRQPL